MTDRLKFLKEIEARAAISPSTDRVRRSLDALDEMRAENSRLKQALDQALEENRRLREQLAHHVVIPVTSAVLPVQAPKEPAQEDDSTKIRFSLLEL